MAIDSNEILKKVMSGEMKIGRIPNSNMKDYINILDYYGLKTSDELMNDESREIL